MREYRIRARVKDPKTAELLCPFARASHGFPNLFTLTGPQSASAFYNNPLVIEDHADFAATAIKAVDEGGVRACEAT